MPAFRDISSWRSRQSRRVDAFNRGKCFWVNPRTVCNSKSLPCRQQRKNWAPSTIFNWFQKLTSIDRSQIDVQPERFVSLLRCDCRILTSLTYDVKPLQTKRRYQHCERVNAGLWHVTCEKRLRESCCTSRSSSEFSHRRLRWSQLNASCVSPCPYFSNRCPRSLRWSCISSIPAESTVIRQRSDRVCSPLSASHSRLQYGESKWVVSTTQVELALFTVQPMLSIERHSQPKADAKLEYSNSQSSWSNEVIQCHSFFVAYHRTRSKVSTYAEHKEQSAKI